MHTNLGAMSPPQGDGSIDAFFAAGNEEEQARAPGDDVPMEEQDTQSDEEDFIDKDNTAKQVQKLLDRYEMLVGVDLVGLGQRELPRHATELSAAKMDWMEEQYKPNHAFITDRDPKDSPSMWQMKQVARGDLMPSVKDRFLLFEAEQLTGTLESAHELH